MTQEEKDLLFKDLSERLPYGVKCDISNYEDSYYDSHEHIEIHLKEEKPIKISGIDFNKNCIYLSNLQIDHVCGYENYGGLKPYLRPMSSMTKEEKKEYELLANHCIVTSVEFVHLEAQTLIDWLNCHHFDYRGLIEKGLALEVTDKNNPYR